MMPDMPLDNENQKSQETDMIKSTLQKLIDDMNAMESDRISPPAPEAAAMPDEMDKAPGLFLGAGISRPNENHAEMYPEAEPETQENQHEPLDESVLNALLDKASHADDEGGTHDDYMDEFDPDVAAAIRKKKKS